MLAATSHTSEAQLHGWQVRFDKIIGMWNRSPLAQDQPLSLPVILGKLKGMLSDHANDQKCLAALFEGWKQQVDREERGRASLALMSGAEVISHLMHYTEQAIESVGGYKAWDALSDEQKGVLQAQAYVHAVQALGEERFQELSDAEKRWTDIFFWGGCGMHKAMNADKWGSRYMQDWWFSMLAKAIGADQSAPVKLYNKASAAAVADQTASTSKKLAEESSKRGGVKATDIAGGILRNKFDKKGQQDNFRWFFASTLGYVVQFPDTNNTRFGSHGMAASELLVHLDIYIEFLDVVRCAKDSGSFNNMENNLYKALHDPSTLFKLAVLALYSQAVTIPYMSFIRRSTHQNALTLGPYHSTVISHCQKIRDNPDIIISLDMDSHKLASLDGAQWDRPEVIYAVQNLIQARRLPFLRELVVAFFTGAVVGWERFTTEFAPGGAVSEASPTELDAAHMRPTNDPCEGAFGSIRQAKRRAPAMTLSVFNAKFMYKYNDTATFEKMFGSSALIKFAMAAAREQDTGAAAQRAREEHARFQKEKAALKEHTRQKAEAKKKEQLEKVEAIVVHLEAEYWRHPPAGVNPTVPEIKDHFRWLRLPSRGVSVPTGWSSLRKEPLLEMLLGVLDTLDEEKIAELYAMNLEERVRLDQVICESDEGEDEGSEHSQVMLEVDSELDSDEMDED